uniref:Ribonuclease H-like domain-containing protein n=1 Tax=Tanacetum cinerariifolium TaxID=118510 RepID=A0A6L2KE64_TANCI|nr:ribonuclease H-like domain-containing protein [Tanacetum cinerariifolium]
MGLTSGIRACREALNKKKLLLHTRFVCYKKMDQDSAHMVAASKLPMLKPGEYELWRIRMELYIQMTDYSLWEVIENGNAPLITKFVEGVETTIAPTTVEEKAQRRLELKAIEKRFGGNAATKKTQRNLLKQQYENFTASRSEDLQQIHPDDLEEMDLRWQMDMLTMRIIDQCKTSLGYNAVPPPYTGNFMPPKPDLSVSGLEKFVNKPIVSELTVKKPVVETSKAKASADKPKAYTLTVNLTIYTSYIEQFWATVKAKNVTREVQLQSLADGKKVIITESTVRRDLQLEDAKGVDCLPNAAIFKQLTLMRKTKRKDIELPQTSDPTTNIADEAVNEVMDDSLVRAATTTSSLEAEVLDLENTKTTQALEIDSLKRRVKKLKKKQRSRTHKLKRLYKVGLSSRVESSDDNKDLGKDASKQGRISDIDADEGITLVSTHDDVEMFDADKDLHVTLAQALAELKHTKPKAKAKRIVFHEPEESTTTTIPKPKSQDKGKGIMVEEHVKLKKKDQILLDEEVVKMLQAEINEKKDLQEKKQEELTDEKKARLFVQFLKKRRKFFEAKRAVEKRNIPPTRAQQRSIMTKLVVESSKEADAEVTEGSSKRAREELEIECYEAKDKG